MSDGFGVSVVLPAYLEEENLRLLLPRIREALSRIAMTSEIVVVDTVTPLDATEEVVAQAGGRLVRRGPGNCFGDAVRTGIAEAKGNYIVFMDADGSHSPELIPQLVSEAANYDVVIASRYIEGGHAENDFVLRAMSRVLNWSYSFILNLKVKDASNSFRVYRAETLKGFTLRCRNFDIVEEILVKITRYHRDATMKEIPATFKKRMFGETKRSLLLFIITYVMTMIRLRLSK
jgi:dolichol-phosphate mannosyltransferase